MSRPRRLGPGTAVPRATESGGMVIVMADDARSEDVAAVVRAVAARGGDAVVGRGGGRTPVGAAGAGCRLVQRSPRTGRSVVRVGRTSIGPGTVTVIARPWAEGTPEQVLAAARMAQRAGASLLHGGVPAPRTSAHPSRRRGRRGLEILADVGAETGMPVIAEVTAPSDVDLVVRRADMLRIGARNMQDTALLRTVGAAGVPVLLERGPTATIEEWLTAAERIARCGNLGIVLCECGGRTPGGATRGTLDISAVPVVQGLSHLPVVVDPALPGSRRAFVLPLARAVIAVGADGLVVDVRPDPATALRDGPGALLDEDLPLLSDAVTELARLVDRRPGRPRRPVAA